MNLTKIKHITLSLLIIIATGGAVLGLSRAVFQDQEVVDPMITMGVLNLQVGQEDPANVPLDFSGMVPEEVRSYTFEVNNTGTVEGNFWMQAFITQSGEGDDPESEPLTIFDGDIAQCASMTFSMVDSENNEVIIINDETIENIDQQVFENTQGSLVDEAVNNGPTDATITIDAYGCGSETMGDILELDLNFHLTQV
jgi:hypothetical protein